MFVVPQTGVNRSIQEVEGVNLTAPAEAILRRNRGIQAAKDIRECKEDSLDLSSRDLGDEGAMELVEDLKVCVCGHCCACLIAT